MQENKENQTENKLEHRTIEKTIEDLLIIIPAQYSELDAYNNELKGLTTNTQNYYDTAELFRKAGISFRASIVFGFGILENNHPQKDHNEIEQNKKLIGEEPFKTMQEAKRFRDITTKLLKNLLENVDTIEEELLMQKIIETI